MSWSHSAACVPYGAYELKATYQRNMLVGVMAVLCLTFALTGSVTLVLHLTKTPPPLPIGIDGNRVVARPTTPPTIIRSSQPLPKPPASPKASRGAIPVALADSLIPGPEQTVPSQDQLRAGFGDGPDIGSGAIAVVVPDSEYKRTPSDTFPGENEIVIVEKYPEVVHMKKPAYPESARRFGLAGTVMVKALIDREGKVREAKVLVSSGFDNLDQAAVIAAYDCVYTPAIQNGRPTAIWVSYKVSFHLNE